MKGLNSYMYEKRIIQLFIFMLIVCITSVAYAAGTPSNTSIENRATINYKVNSISQSEIESSPTGNSTAGTGNGADTTFVVDNKVDLTVTTIDAAIVEVTPGALAQALTFSVTNNGNTVQDYSLTAPNSSTGAFGETETFDATNVLLRVESGATPGYQAGQDTATYIDELAPDASKTVYVISDIPVDQVNGDVASYNLIAQTAQGGGSGSQGSDITSDDSGTSDTAATVQIVFADGDADGAGSVDSAKNGKYSSLDGYKCISAVLTITKTSAVISDPINNTTNPKRIPGAIIEYTVTIANTAGAATATNISVVDSLDTEISAGTIGFYSNGYEVGKGIEVTAPNINGGAAKNLTNAGSDDEGDFNVTTANTVTVTGIELDGGELATIKYRVDVK